MLKPLASTAWRKDITPLGFGCCPMGGFGWGQVNDDELHEAVAVALDLGIQLFDTSDIYGLGASEQLLGKAIQGRRQKAIISTKFGVRNQNGRTYYDTSPAWIREAAEGSLRRLAVDCIDLYQMHYWDGVTPIEQIFEALESLRSAGKVRNYGVTNFDPLVLTEAASINHLSSFSFHYSLVHREHEDLILTVQRQTGAFFMSWGSLGQGILSGKYQNLEQLATGDRRRGEAYKNFHGEKFVAIQLVLQQLQEISTEAGISGISQLALRWIIDRLPNALPLVGIKRPSQIIDASEALHFKLDPDILAKIDLATAQFKLSASLQ